MSDDGDNGQLPGSVGERLRSAREAQNLSLAEVAARTRIPLRHLAAIETGDYAALPSATYAVGFAKAYARAVGADEVAIGHEVRERDDATVSRREYETYAINDPRRLPPRMLAIGAAVLGVLLLVGATIWLAAASRGAPATVEEAGGGARTIVIPPTPRATADGQVRLTATGDVWLRVYDFTGKSLFEKTLKAGESYDVPGDADRPMINIGRADKLQVTVNGAQVAPLGDGKFAIKDVGVSAAALAARTPGPDATSATSPAASLVNASGERTPSARRVERAAAPTVGETAPLNIALPAAAPTSIATGQPTP